MRAFEYASASRIDQAAELGSDTARFLAGGTDLLPLMKLDVAQPSRLVNVKGVSELAGGIRSDADGLAIGALTTLAEIERSQLLQERYAALVEAVSQAATPQLRNMATLGGNLLQRPRCWYFRSAQFQCWLKGGDVCHAREGQNQMHAIFDASPCVAVHPSDPPAALLALDAWVEMSSGRESRRVPLSEFFTLPHDGHRMENVLRAGELITCVRVPHTPGLRSTYRKAMNRKVWSFALVGVAAALRFDGGRVASARLVLNGVAPVPWRVPAAERALEGGALDESTIARAAEAALTQARPLALNGYKVALARGLIHQALRALNATGPVAA